MAQVIASYSAETTSRSYIYYVPNGLTGGVQYESYTAVVLTADYAERLTRDRYPCLSPTAGWVLKDILQNIKPMYKTVTDRCTPPSALSINVAAKSMTITGGAGGDLNTFTGFGVSWRERSITGVGFGAWSDDVYYTNRTVDVGANAGMVRQYRVRTRGSAGETYYSEYALCDTLVIGNTDNKVPVILLPGRESVTGSCTPVVAVSCAPDAEGDQMNLMRSIDGGDWQAAAGVTAAGGTVFDHLLLTKGSHSIRYKLVDVNGGESDAAALNITVDQRVWSRQIAPGDVISNAEISHRADVIEMLEALNVQRAYYGKTPVVLPGTVGRFGDWLGQMNALLTGANECIAAAGQTAETFQIDQPWPNAETINQIRTRILMV